MSSKNKAGEQNPVWRRSDQVSRGFQEPNDRQLRNFSGPAEITAAAADGRSPAINDFILLGLS